MDVSHILDHLNDQQRKAVTSEKKHLMVLAGAGSGKTRVLVHKIAWEVEALKKNPASIMAVTFTNKAALEMRSRIEELLEAPMTDGWVGTFHGLAHRMLKRFHKEASLSSGFTILDSDDQLRIIKRISKLNGKSMRGRTRAFEVTWLMIKAITLKKILIKFIKNTKKRVFAITL
jgi:DNA helicase-2/ATP-dependent DNA helicase PcrA